MAMPQQGSVPNAQADADSSTEAFLMYGYKVVQCSKRYRHDWSVCPFAHTGEMAARRDPSRYLPIFCFHSKQRLPCPRGEDCPYSHNLFEYWLHPQRYRTEMCQFGAACTRPVCFFAHGEHQLRHTTMPGGPQPVVAPPEPIPSLNGGFGHAHDLGAPMDPAVKQQQQLMALHAAAAGFSSQQQAAAAAAAAAAVRSDVGLVDHLGQPTGCGQAGPGAPPGGGGFPSLMDGGGSMDMSAALQSQLSLAAGHPASAPLSAPLPQLSPDLLAALQGMGPGMPAIGTPGSLMHTHSGIPPHAAYSEQLPAPGRLQRSLTAHPAATAAAAAAAGAGGGQPLEELTKQLTMMQLMQGGGAGASAPLPQLGSAAMDSMLLQQLQQQAGEQAVVTTSGLDLAALLPPASSGLVGGGGLPDASFSCPLPPVYALAPAGVARQPSPPAAVSCSLPRVPTVPGFGAAGGAPASPLASDGGRDAPSPGPDGRDAQVAAPGKKGHPWSAPVSPCNSSARGGNDLASGVDDAKLTSISFTAGAHSSSCSESSESVAGNSGRLASIPSEAEQQLVRGTSGVLLSGAELPSFSAGIAPAAPAPGGARAEQPDGAAALLVIGDHAVPASHASAVLGGGVKQQQQQQQPEPAVSLRPHRGGAAQQAGGQQPIGQEMAAKLLAQLPEDSVRRLLDLVQQQQAPAGHP